MKQTRAERGTGLELKMNRANSANYPTGTGSRSSPSTGPTNRSPNQRQRIVELLRERGSAGAIFEPRPKQPTDQIPPLFAGVSR